MSTKLEAFITKHKLKPSELARTAGYSRQHLLRLRKGTMEPTRRCMAAITKACRHMTGAKIKAADLFDLDAEDVTGAEKE